MLRSLFTISGLTLVSRILGMVRDMMVSHYLGTGAAADAWVAAFRFPNLFRRVFGEGAFNSAFVPMYSRRLEEQGDEGADRFGSKTLSLMFVILAGIFVLAFIFMGPITKVMAMGFDAERYALAVDLSRITVVYLVFVCLMAAFSGILNSRRSFAPPAIAYIMLNVVFIAGLTLVATRIGHAEYVLSWCVAIAGVIQLGIVIVAARRNGAKLRPMKPRIDGDMKQLGLLMVPGLVSAGIQQLNLIVGQSVASFQEGAQMLIYNADRVNQLPLGIIGIAFSVVLLPEISRHLRGGRETLARRSMAQGIEFSLLISLPAMVALIVIPEAIINGLFRSGQFNAEDVHQTGLALMAFAIGSPAYILIRVLQPGYFAREDTKTPMRFTIITAITNIVLCVPLFLLMRHVGCALATSIAGWVNVILLTVGLRKLGFIEMSKGFTSRTARMVLSSALMGAALWGIGEFAEPWLFAEGRLVRIVSVLAVSGAGFVIYLVLILVTRVTSVAELKAKFRRAPKPVTPPES
ncbi:MAG: murein biosynthesis integral membrane protein MurJ [Verrucomicrobiae bacterium]|nr:murein biosynthesis integral membrane protein MurJ [Verrucomicrobiae bacterium]